MNRCRIVALCSLMLAAAGTHLKAATLQVDSKDASVRPTIDKFFAEKIPALVGEDAAAATAARTAIIAEVLPAAPSSPQPTPSFFDAFCLSLADSSAAPLKSSDPKIRLNIAIVVARVAERANSDKLVPVTVQLLGDSSPAIVHWGVRAAKYELPVVLGTVAGRNGPLMEALSKAVVSHVTDESLVAAAYDALSLPSVGTNAIPAAQWPMALPPAIDLMQTIMERRIALYQHGHPPAPATEQLAVLYMVSDKVWQTPSPTQNAQQKRTLQLMLELVSDAGQRSIAASNTDRPELTDILKKSSGDFQVVGKALGDDAIVDAAKKVGTTGYNSDIQARLDALSEAVTKLPNYKGINPPTTLPATMPSSAPTTAP